MNSKSSSYLRSLEAEFGVSTNAIRIELNKFEKAGLLQSQFVGNKKLFRANTKHPLFQDIHNILLKQYGIDGIVETVVKNLGKLEMIFLTGSFANGINSEIIDLIFVGDEVNEAYLLELIHKAKKFVKRKVKYLLMKVDEFVEFREKKKDENFLLLWKRE
ncbi:ArsR family transcriptional regulator [Bacteroidota bacterium]